MIAIGVFLAWFSYGLGVWGVSLIKGWNLGFKDIWSPVSYYQGKWPPQVAGNTTIVPDGTKNSLTTASFQTATSGTSTPASGTSGAPGQPSGLSNTATIQKVAAMFGWGSGSQWNCLTAVINAESGGNPKIANPSSGAFGIAQALGHGGSGTSGCGRNQYGAQYGLSSQQASQANCGNAWYQMLWMCGYIKAVYGNPCNAWAHEQSHHWY